MSLVTRSSWHFSIEFAYLVKLNIVEYLLFSWKNEQNLLLRTNEISFGLLSVCIRYSCYQHPVLT